MIDFGRRAWSGDDLVDTQNTAAFAFETAKVEGYS